jgi:hypothetical protein
VLAVQATDCTGLNALNPVCQVGSLGGSLAASGFESVLSGISQWVASGAEWLLGQIGSVLTSTTTVDLGATWFRAHYGQMTALAGVVILPLLLVSTLQAIVRQNPGQLVRTFLLQLPLALTSPRCCRPSPPASSRRQGIRAWPASCCCWSRC